MYEALGSIPNERESEREREEKKPLTTLIQDKEDSKAKLFL
jgi:hypothetical protein